MAAYHCARLRCLMVLVIHFFNLSLHPVRLGGGIGRHAGLKIPWPAMAVRVRFPSEAHQSLVIFDYEGLLFYSNTTLSKAAFDSTVKAILMWLALMFSSGNNT